MLWWHVFWAINNTNMIADAHHFILDKIDTKPETTTLSQG